MSVLRSLPCWLVIGMCGFAGICNGQEIVAKFLPEGVTARVGGYRPIRAEMDLEADVVKTAPDGLTAPKYGEFKIDDKSWVFILDEPEEGDARLFVDTNGDGDLTNDPETKWESETRGEFTMYSGTCQIDLGNDNLGGLGLYRFDPTDEGRKALKNTMMFYIDFGYEYAFQIDGQELSSFVAGTPEEGGRLPIDRDGNGKISSHFEVVNIGEPFNFTGTTSIINLEDGMLTLEKADEEIAVAPMPPNLEVGEQALQFSATTMTDENIDFPGHYAGKIVMLDFWATWCGPCIGEIPHMKVAYDDWHDKGFEILGITLDSEDMTEQINEFMEKHEITWPQVYQGKGWEVDISVNHDVSGIPFVLLVDGDSGKILATAKQLRGEGLSEFIGKQLELKNGKSSEDSSAESSESGDDR